MVFEWESGGKTKMTRATLKFSQDYRMATYESIVSHFGTLKAFEALGLESTMPYSLSVRRPAWS
jgi:hypothetical protein